MAKNESAPKVQTPASPKSPSEIQGLDTAAAEGESPEASRPDEESTESTAGSSGIPVVALGGSAGSLGSFEVFFAGLPATSGAAFVVIQHLAPAHASLLPELVAQHTRMKVVQAQDGEPVEPNCVYVIPPNHYLGIRDGVLYLAEPVKQDGIRMPIDFFFRSVAEDRQQRAVGILFSGAGSDGTLGVRAIRGGGGLVIAQDPHTAQFDTMPRIAIATGLVDYVLPPARMPEKLLEYLGHPYVRGGEPAAVLAAEGKPGGVLDILALVLSQTGCDFRCYKKTTILRRIERRMGLHRISDVARYTELLSGDAHEVGELLKDLLINVTSFFRDAEAFEELRHKAIRPLVEAKPADEPVRIWVPGCSTGEEAYSLTILWMEEIAAARKNCPVQVFATDIDEEALKFARLGVYPESIAVDVEAGRLAKFFLRKESGYHVSEALRKAVVFAAQNLIADPPFSKMDLISCRNLLIYLDSETQAKLAPLWNFALNPGGYLFLGKSEGIGGRSDLFDVVSKKARLYRRLAPAHPIALDSPIFPGQKRTIPIGPPAMFGPPAAGLTDVIRQALLSHFAASVVLIDRKGQILQFHGQTGKYLNMPTAEPRLNLLEIAKPGVSLHLRPAMHKAIEDGKTVALAGVSITRDEDGPLVRITVAPAAQRGETEPLLAVIFEDVPRPATAGVELPPSGPSETSETVVRQLEDELKAAQYDLQASIDDLQASNEELRVANEEVISSNEELQSTNEELETSKEELQSVNEELVTVNSQLQEKVHQLDTANNDMANLLKSSEIATLFLDNELRIKFFTPAMTRVLHLIPADMGRPLTDLAIDLIGCDLAADARAVIEGAPVAEKEVRHADGASYFLRVVPYRTQSDRVDGVVITLVDLTNLRRAEGTLHGSEERLRRAQELAHLGSWELDVVHDRLTWSDEVYRIFGLQPQEFRATYEAFLEAVHPDDRAAVDAAYASSLREGRDTYEIEHRLVRKSSGEVRIVHEKCEHVRDGSGRIVRSVGMVNDITERTQAEEALKAAKDSAEQAKAAAEQANRAKDHFLAVLSHELRTPLTPVVMGLSMLQNRPDLEPAIRETLEMVRRNVELEALLIDDLLDVSRIARGKIELTRSTVELCTVIRRAAEVCQPDIEARRLHFGVDLGPAAPYWVEADVPRLQQVFWNLLKNAIKFTPPGGCVGIRCRPNEKYVLVEVNDSGMGIEPGALARIFNAFEQAEHSTAQQFGGLGLGLAISKMLVEMHGGQIEAHSEGRDKGATFRVRLPLAAPPGQPEVRVRTAPPQRVVRPLRVLLVEDHGVTAQMMRMVLTAEGHTVEAAGDVATALELAGQHTFDLLLSDLGLPDGSGYDLMCQLRQRGHKLPGIALSGYGQREDIQRSREAGFSAHLTKPASREAVVEVVASVAAAEMPTTAVEPTTESKLSSRAEVPVLDARVAAANAGRASATPSPAEPMSPPAATVFDPELALKHCLNKADLLQQMIAFFFKDAESVFPQMRAALQNGDLTEVGRLGHRVKGTLVHLAAEPAREAARRVERFMLHAGEQADAEEAVRALEHQCEVLRAVLSEYQATIGPMQRDQ